VAVIKFIFISVVIPVRAVTITTGALTNLASTAACPNTRVPTIFTACPIGAGILVPASRKRSNINSIINRDTVVGTGTPWSEAEKLNNRGVGSISWW